MLFEMHDPEKITRRDFLNGTLLASGAALVSAVCPFNSWPLRIGTVLPVSATMPMRMATRTR